VKLGLYLVEELSGENSYGGILVPFVRVQEVPKFFYRTRKHEHISLFKVAYNLRKTI
jgi:hypothetical protein